MKGHLMYEKMTSALNAKGDTICCGIASVLSSRPVAAYGNSNDRLVSSSRADNIDRPLSFIPSLLQSNLIHHVGLSHHLLALNFIILSFGKKSAWSSARVKVTDTDFDGVEVRVFEGSPKPDQPLRRSVVYIHGGGWALASASMSQSPSYCMVLWLALGRYVIEFGFLSG
jgi:hypothetical protein